MSETLKYYLHHFFSWLKGRYDLNMAIWKDNKLLKCWNQQQKRRSRTLQDYCIFINVQGIIWVKKCIQHNCIYCVYQCSTTLPYTTLSSLSTSVLTYRKRKVKEYFAKVFAFTRWTMKYEYDLVFVKYTKCCTGAERLWLRWPWLNSNVDWDISHFRSRTLILFMILEYFCDEKVEVTSRKLWERSRGSVL